MAADDDEDAIFRGLLFLIGSKIDRKALQDAITVLGGEILTEPFPNSNPIANDGSSAASMYRTMAEDSGFEARPVLNGMWIKQCIDANALVAPTRHTAHIPPGYDGPTLVRADGEILFSMSGPSESSRSSTSSSLGASAARANASALTAGGGDGRLPAAGASTHAHSGPRSVNSSLARPSVSGPESTSAHPPGPAGTAASGPGAGGEAGRRHFDDDFEHFPERAAAARSTARAAPAAASARAGSGAAAASSWGQRAVPPAGGAAHAAAAGHAVPLGNAALAAAALAGGPGAEGLAGARRRNTFSAGDHDEMVAWALVRADRGDSGGRGGTGAETTTGWNAGRGRRGRRDCVRAAE
jgi:hypothetical protein